MGLYGRDSRKPRRKAKNAQKRPLRAPSVELDTIMCEHGECKAVWRDDAKRPQEGLAYQIT